MKLSEENPDRRKKIDQLSQADKEIVYDVDKRMIYNETVLKEVSNG